MVSLCGAGALAREKSAPLHNCLREGAFSVL